jgi:hypothetical protein
MNQPSTLLAAVLASLEAAGQYNKNDQVAPAVILWTDKERQWEPLVPRLREHLPQLLTLGAYNPAIHTGPAIWLRCLLARTLPEADWPEEVIPILYLPGIARQELRAVEECAKPLQPLAELQYRGTYWTHQNGKDWTPLAFLQTKEGGLGLDVARDNATVEALRRALIVLAETPLGELQGRRLEASDFDALLLPDPVRDLLGWLNDPAGTRQRWDAGAWESFRSICRQQYGFDPQTDGELTGAERLGAQQGAWLKVWARFVEAPRRYPNLPELLRRAKPAPAGSALFMTTEPSPAWPQDNEALETELRQMLLALEGRTRKEAATNVAVLEAQHGPRREWVWAELWQAPLARALKPLARLAELSGLPVIGTTPAAMAASYVESGWRTDEAVLDALAQVKTNDDYRAVCAAIRALYLPWLEETTHRFQSLVGQQPLPDHQANTAASSDRSEKDCAILFADGLRFDTGKKLQALLAARGWQIAERWHWVALPSVTPTAKPAVSPIARLLDAGSDSDDFRPVVAEAGKALTTDRFKQLMSAQGCQILSANETGDGSGSCWTEIGDLDSYGHAQGWKLARRVEEVLDEAVERIATLLEAGWKRIRIVTDHGWLLLPGGLPKSEMPAYLAETRWGRCAVLKETAKVDTPVVSWHWNPDVRIAVAPGIAAFKHGFEYAHGGLSLQECVAIELNVTPAAPSLPQAAIAEVRWAGLRCRVRVRGEAVGLSADIRTKAADPASSITQAKPVGADGQAALLIENDSLEGTAAFVVLLTADGRVLAKQQTTIGE